MSVEVDKENVQHSSNLATSGSESWKEPLPQTQEEVFYDCSPASSSTTNRTHSSKENFGKGSKGKGKGKGKGGKGNIRQRKYDVDGDGRDDDGLVRGAIKVGGGDKVFTFGNYDAYYQYRSLPDSTSDGRIDALKKAYGQDFFKGKSVLDIGCNAGWVTMQLAKSCGAKRALGVDIDVSLVGKALRDLRNVKDEILKKEEESGKPPKKDEDYHGEYPWNVEFRAQDVVNTDLSSWVPANEQFDVICCFSVTKWVHFNFGDDGIKRLFNNIRKLLAPDGIFVLEPQDFKSYKKKRWLTNTIRENVRAIELRPHQFSDYLKDTYDFAVLPTLKPDKNAVSTMGFDRPLQIYRAPNEPFVDSGTTKDFERESWMHTQQTSSSTTTKQSKDGKRDSIATTQEVIEPPIKKQKTTDHTTNQEFGQKESKAFVESLTVLQDESTQKFISQDFEEGESWQEQKVEKKKKKKSKIVELPKEQEDEWRKNQLAMLSKFMKVTPAKQKEVNTDTDMSPEKESSKVLEKENVDAKKSKKRRKSVS